MRFNLPLSNLRSNHYSLYRFEEGQIFGVILEQLNEYWSDRKIDNGRWRSI